MITLFHCKSCNNYMRHVSAVVAFRATVYLAKDGVRLSSEDGHFNDLVDVYSKMKCYECGSEEVEQVELEQCPHYWQEFLRNERECRLCGITQKGRVVYDE